MNAYRFRVALTSPLKLKGKMHAEREGVLIERDGCWAEASPLPGFSEETIEDVISAIRGERSNPPSLDFALSSLEEPIENSIQALWNFLLLGDRQQVLEGVQQCVQSGCHAAKLKVGRSDPKSEIELVKEVRKSLPEYVKLRLDANQAWTMDEATEFLAAVSDVDLEYIEEPLGESTELEKLYASTGVRYALDETLLSHESLDPWPNVVALVCKPTILGGRGSIERLASTGKPLVFSSAFESGVGVSRIVQLAAEFSPQIPAGLDTLDWMTTDLLECSPEKQGHLFVVAGEPIVDVSQLERIE